MLNRKIPQLLALFVLAGTLALYALELRSLFIVPVYDSVRWGGDETWLMREFGNQARHGVMQYPENFGGAPRTDGVLAGSMWSDALIYGVPGNLLWTSYDYASIGRTVTATLGLLLIASLYFILRRLGVQQLIAAISIALMVVNQGFVWATHSARYDLLTGLTLLWYCYYLARLSARGLILSKAPSPSGERGLGVRFSASIFGIASVATIIFSRHMLTLGLPATLLCLWSLRIWKSRNVLLAYIIGAIGTVLFLSIVYWAGAGEFSLFGRGGNLGSFRFVIRQIPIFRPFSRNVQISNLGERLGLLYRDIPGILILLAAMIVLVIGYKAWQWSMLRKGTRIKLAITPHQQFFLLSCLLCSLSWLLLEGSRPYYLFHVVPLLIVGGAVTLELWSEVYQSRWSAKAAAIAILVAGLFLQAGHALPSMTLGNAIAQDQSAAIKHLMKECHTESGRKSRVLFDVAGLDRALTDTIVQIMTLDMFQPTPSADDAIRKLEINRIDFVVLRSSPVSTPFEPGRALLPHILDSIGEVRDSALGFFYDDGRTYDENLSTMIEKGLDTLRLYSTHWTPH